MRKICLVAASWLLAVSVSVPALASSNVSFTGRIVAGKTVSITAPFGGTVQDFDWRVGDEIAKGAVLLSLSTDKLYAPCDGTVGNLRAQAGDSAESVQSMYDALLLIEPDSKFSVSSDTKDAYDSTTTKYVHAGETVYLQATSHKSRTGVGFISAVKGSTYTVEVTSGNLKMGDKVSVYRSSSHTRKTRVGKGVVGRMDPVAVTGEGGILHMHVAEGDHVAKGDLLFELVAGDLLGVLPEDNQVRVSERGVLATIDVGPSEVVTDGQVLAALNPTGTLEASIAVNEMDLRDVVVGGKMTIELDSDASRVYEGIVLSISSISTGTTSDAEYTAYLSFPNDDFVREGMSVTVTAS